MSNDLRESLSALMDGEASELEVRRLLRDGDAQSNAFWARLHSQRAVLQRDRQFPQWDISAGVQQAIAAESPHRVARADWRKPLGGFAVAASVAALVVFGLGGNPESGVNDVKTPQVAESSRVYLSSPATTSTGAVAASIEHSSRDAGQSVGVPRYQQVSDEQSRRRFEHFLQQHTERAAFNNGQGMVTYARLVSHGAE